VSVSKIWSLASARMREAFSSPFVESGGCWASGLANSHPVTSGLGCVSGGDHSQHRGAGPSLLRHWLGAAWVDRRVEAVAIVHPGQA